MKGSEFVRRVRQLARKRGVFVDLQTERGKGSHSMLFYGNRRTVIRNLKDEIKTGTLHGMLKQLGLSLDDLAD